MKKIAFAALALQSATGAQGKALASPGAAGPAGETAAVCLPESGLALSHPIPNALPEAMLTSYRAVMGNKEKDALYIMDKVLINGEIQPDAFEQIMMEVSPRALFDAMNQASWCGARANDVADSMKSCLDHINDQRATTARMQLQTRPPTQDEAAQFNLARLAFARLFGQYVSAENRVVKPVFLATSIESGRLGEAAKLQDPIRKHVFVLAGLPAKLTMAVLMHELLHASTHAKARRKLRDFANEAVTEFLSTREFSKVDNDSKYERDGSDRLVSKFIEKMMAIDGALEPGSFEAGMELLKRAYLGGDTPALQRLSAVMTSATEEWKEEMMGVLERLLNKFPTDVGKIGLGIGLTLMIAYQGHSLLSKQKFL